MTDRELIELYTQRSEEALAATQDQYGAYCRTIVGRIMGSPEDTEECLSDVWLKVWNAIPPQRPEHFKGWLGAIARNTAITYCHSRSRQPEGVGESAMELLLDLSPGPQAQAEAKALGQAISDFLHTRSSPTRTAFLRRYWYGDSVEDTARRLGWSVGKTKTVLFRTRKQLKDYLKKEELL